MYLRYLQISDVDTGVIEDAPPLASPRLSGQLRSLDLEGPDSLSGPGQGASQMENGRPADVTQPPGLTLPLALQIPSVGHRAPYLQRWH